MVHTHICRLHLTSLLRSSLSRMMSSVMGWGGGEWRPMSDPSIRVTESFLCLGDPLLMLLPLAMVRCILTSFRKWSRTPVRGTQLSAVETSTNRAPWLSERDLASTSSTSRRWCKSLLFPSIKTHDGARRSDSFWWARRKGRQLCYIFGIILLSLLSTESLT